MKKLLKLNAALYSQPASTIIKILQIISRSLKKFNEDAGLARAGGLAFSTLIAAIPFAALIVSLMNAFGALDNVQKQITEFILRLFVPTSQGEAKAMLDQFLSNSDKLGVVGLVFFTLTSILLLNTINVNLNAVWGSKAKTNFLSKLTTYTSVIIFGALLLAASTAINSRFSFIEFNDSGLLKRAFLFISPFIFNFFIIMLIIGLTPSGTVRLKSIFIASVVASILLELAKYAFVNVSSWAIRASVIYGTIAVIPIFLFWVYILWLIIIGAMELAWVHQHSERAWMGKNLSEMSPVEFITFGFELFVIIAKNFDSGENNLHVEKLSNRFSASNADIHKITTLFEKKNLLLKAGENNDKWVPARSLENIEAAEVIGCLFGVISHLDNEDETASEVIDTFYSAGKKALKDYSILRAVKS